MFERLQAQSNNSDFALILARHVVALLATASGYVAIAKLVHALGLTPLGNMDAQYRYTSILIPQGPGYLMIPLVAAFFGWLTRRPRSVALGMIVPLPFAMSHEMSLNPTSHNLFPIEVIGWIIPFGVAFGAAYVGRMIRNRARSAMS